MNLTKWLGVLGITLMVALCATPALANHVDTATVNANCNGYAISLAASALNPNTNYTITWTITLTPTSGSPITVTGSDPFYSQIYTTASTTLTANFPPLAGAYTLSGTATLVGFNTIPITFSPPTLSCPVPVCTIPASGTAIPGDAVSWNKFSAPSGAVVWIHAHIGTPSGVSTTTTTTVQFTGVTFVLNGITYALPDGLLIFSPTASATPMTSFDSTFTPNGRWVTTLNPNKLSDEIFFDGNAVPVDSNISGGGKATFNYTTLSSSNSLKFSWQWSAAVFTYWPGNNAAQILPYHQSDHAGTPENKQVQQSLIQGPRGGGGSNYTGSWSGTGHGQCPGAN